MTWMTTLWRLWHHPTPERLMQEQLSEAQRQLVLAEQARDYADAVVTYHQVCIARLESRLNAAPPADATMQEIQA